MALPTSCVYQGKEVPLYTFKQLEQQARKTLGNRAKDLRDLSALTSCRRCALRLNSKRSPRGS